MSPTDAAPRWSPPEDLASRGGYLWAGVTVDSNLPLHRLPATGNQPQVRFRWRAEPAPEAPPARVRRTLKQRDGTELTLEVGGTHDDLWYRIGDVGTFVLRPGASIIDLYPAAGADPMRVEHWLVNAVLATYEGLRGVLCLHASAVARDGTAVVFTGPSGIGKSTRAWRLVSEGWELLSDDVAVIRPAGEGWEVWPASRTVRLEGLAEPGSWDNRGKGEVLVEGADSPRELGEIRLVLAKAPANPMGPAVVQVSLLRCQWGWEWASADARGMIDRSMWDLVSKVPVKTEVWEGLE